MRPNIFLIGRALYLAVSEVIKMRQFPEGKQQLYSRPFITARRCLIYALELTFHLSPTHTHAHTQWCMFYAEMHQNRGVFAESNTAVL